jgi:hypothetical protein
MKALHQKVGKRTLKDKQVSNRLCRHHLKGPPTSSPKTWIEQSTADGVMLQMFVGSALREYWSPSTSFEHLLGA